MTPEEISAAEAALAKQKPASDLIDPNDDVYEFDGHRNEYFGKVHSVCPQMAGVSRKSCGRDIRSTKKPRKDAKVNEPETKSVIKPAAPHESAKVEETKPTTVRGWLETIPDPAIRAAAIRQCRWPDYTVNSPEDALKSGLFWCECSEGGAFWSMCHSAALGDRPWPAYPPKAKQEADGWTQAETDKAKWNDYLNSKRDDETVIFDIHGDAPKESILKEAESLVHGDRRRDYGTPDENFARIARRWTAILNHPVTTTQVVECMIALKFARQEEKPKRDNWVDIAGYAQCGSELTISTKTK